VLAFTVAGMLRIVPETNPLHWQLGAPLVYGGATLGFLLAGLLLRRSPAWRGWPRSHGGPGMQDRTELARHRPGVCSPAAHTSPSGKEQE
jgi:hypothetical protein